MQPHPPTEREQALLELLARLNGSDILRPDAQAGLAASLCTYFGAEVAFVLLYQNHTAAGTVCLNAEVHPFSISLPVPEWEQFSLPGAIFGSRGWDSSAGDVRGLVHLQSNLSLNIDSWIGTPLQMNEVTAGVLLVGKPAPFAVSEFLMLTTIAEIIAGQMQNQALIASLQITNAGLEASREQLLHSRNVLRALFDSFPDGLYIIDRDYRLTAVNMQRARRTGKHPTALVGQLCYRALYNRESPCTECRIWGTMHYGENTKQNRRGKSPDGEIQEWELHSYPIRDAREAVVQAILLEQDITDKRRLELTLAQSEKLAAVGQWAASLAHEINNPLTAIIANAQLLEREIPQEDDRRELVDLISLASERANQVVRNLLDLARKDEYLFGATNINETIERALSFLQHEIVARSTSLVFEPDASLPPIQASPDHLQGVWLNLLTNALDSVPDREGEILVRTSIEGDEVCVLITDNGGGIPTESLTRIFEPFYTTKAPGRGTGLGLPVCQRIIEQHGGRISVESQPGAGTRFTVLLPVA